MAKKLKYAVIDGDVDFHALMIKNINSGSYGNCFKSSMAFGKSKIKDYDIIFIGNPDGSYKKEDIAEAIKNKTNAIIVIIKYRDEKLSNRLKKSKDFRVAPIEAFDSHKKASDFLTPFYHKMEERKNIKSLRSNFDKLSKEISRMPKYA